MASVHTTDLFHFLEPDQSTSSSIDPSDKHLEIAIKKLIASRAALDVAEPSKKRAWDDITRELSSLQTAIEAHHHFMMARELLQHAK